MWPTDLEYGILGYGYDDGIGGVLKTIPEDFVVTEVDPHTMRPLPKPPKDMYQHGDGAGLFLCGRVWKKDIDHARMKRQLSKVFKVPEKSISTAGIKDKRAITTQLFSVYQPMYIPKTPLQVANNLEIDGLANYRERMYPGRMGGNYFEITIRETNKLTQNKLDSFGKYLDNGILNYYGYQRFGGNRPITAEFGRHILNEDYFRAIDLYLGGRSAGKDEKYRQMWRDNRDPNELLMNWDNIPLIERDILLYLSRKKNDYFGAIRKIPEFLINLSKSAFISLLFNHYVSRRGIGMDLQKGERIVSTHLPSIVNPKLVENIEIALPSKRWKEPLNDDWNTVFEKYNLQIKELKTISHTSRMLILHPIDFEGIVLDDNSALVQFQLPVGAYATTVLRELMQVPPIHFV